MPNALTSAFTNDAAQGEVITKCTHTRFYARCGKRPGKNKMPLPGMIASAVKQEAVP
jgi:hypothetical protein